MDQDDAIPATSRGILPGSAARGGQRVLVMVPTQDQSQWIRDKSVLPEEPLQVMSK